MTTDGIALPPSQAGVAQLLLAQASGNNISLGKAEIVDIPPELQGQNVRGEVVSTGSDGTVTVKTEQGEELVLKPKLPLPVGQKISVSIPPESTPGQSVTVKLASSLPASSSTGSVSASSQDTVSQTISSKAEVSLQSTAQAVQLGKPVRSVLYEFPIRFTQAFQEAEISGSITTTDSVGRPLSVVENPMSMHEILQQAESDFMSPLSQKIELLLHQFVHRNIVEQKDTLIRTILGLKESAIDYKPPVSLQKKTVDLPLLNKSFTTLNTQTSALSLHSFSQNIAMQHFGVDLPDILHVIKAFQGNITQNVLATQMLNNANSTVVDARVVQVQNTVGGMVASATTPQTILTPMLQTQEQMFQPFFMVGDIIDADMPHNGLMRLIQSPLESSGMLKASSENPISVRPQLVQAIFLGNVDATHSVTAKNTIIGNTISSGMTPPSSGQPMGLWATPLGVLALPSVENIPFDIGQNAVIQLTPSGELSALVKPILTITQPVISPLVSGITNEIPSLDSVLGEDWPALQKSIEALFDINVALARSFMSNIPMPSSPPQFTPAVIFFLAALRIGNLKAWTGEKMIDALERAGKGDLVKRLSGDFAQASARSKEPLADGWRPFHIPVLYDENLSRLQFMVRQDGEDDEKGKKSSGNKSTRFLIDLKLSRIGDIQLDGYIRGKNLDMIVRTKEQLPAEMQQNIRQRFTHAVDMTGMNGSIRLFGRGEGWVKVKRPSGASGVRV